MGLGSHEQYSFPFYGNHLPDHFERMDVGLRYLMENRYTAMSPTKGFWATRRGKTAPDRRGPPSALETGNVCTVCA